MKSQAHNTSYGISAICGRENPNCNWWLKQVGELDSTSSKKLRATDLLLSVGGDNTLLGAVAVAAREDIPLLLIDIEEANQFNFLMELKGDKALNDLHSYLSGDFWFEEIKLLRVKMSGGDEYEDTLGDVVIRAGSNPKVIKIELCSNGVQSVTCAGLFVATFTGYASRIRLIDPKSIDPRKGTYPYMYKRLQSFETREFMGGNAVESDFKLTASVSDDNGQATLEVDGRPSKLKWNETRTVEFCASPNRVKLLRRKTQQ